MSHGSYYWPSASAFHCSATFVETSLSDWAWFKAAQGCFSFFRLFGYFLYGFIAIGAIIAIRAIIAIGTIIAIGDITNFTIGFATFALSVIA